jgi:hypothetical protein
MEQIYPRRRASGHENTHNVYYSVYESLTNCACFRPTQSYNRVCPSSMGTYGGMTSGAPTMSRHPTDPGHTYNRAHPWYAPG